MSLGCQSDVNRMSIRGQGKMEPLGKTNKHHMNILQSTKYTNYVHTLELNLVSPGAKTWLIFEASPICNIPDYWKYANWQSVVLGVERHIVKSAKVKVDKLTKLKSRTVNQEISFFTAADMQYLSEHHSCSQISKNIYQELLSHRSSFFKIQR